MILLEREKRKKLQKKLKEVDVLLLSKEILWI